MGIRNVVVRAKEIKADELPEVRKKSLGVSMRDAEAISEAVPGVERILPRVEIEAYKILSPAGKTKARVYGVSSRHPELVTMRVDEGRFFDEADERSHAQACVLGSDARRDLFGV